MNESILKDMSPYDMITESDVDSLDEALPVDANIRVCTPSVESELDTTNTDELNGSIQTVTQDDSNTLSLVVSADMKIPLQQHT